MRLLAADAWRFVERTGRFRKLPTPALPGSGKGYSALCGSQPYGAPVFMSAHSIRAVGQKVKPADIIRPGSAYVIPLQSWNAGRRDMKADPEQRAVQLGEYIAAHNATVRAAAAAFGCSKSTVHKDVAVRLRSISPVEEEKNSNQPLDKREQAKAALTELFESIRTEDTPIIVERVVADIDENVVAIVRKFKDAFKSITAQREIKKKLRSILWVNYQIKDQEVFDKAYQYIEMYY